MTAQAPSRNACTSEECSLTRFPGRLQLIGPLPVSDHPAPRPDPETTGTQSPTPGRRGSTELSGILNWQVNRDWNLSRNLFRSPLSWGRKRLEKPFPCTENQGSRPHARTGNVGSGNGSDPKRPRLAVTRIESGVATVAVTALESTRTARTPPT